MTGIQEVLFDERAIAAKVSDIAEEISEDYAGKEVLLVCVLKGAVVFTADLMRRLRIPVVLDFVQAASYGAGTASSRSIIIKKDLESDVSDRHVLLVDTIVDSGETLDCLFKRFADRKPASLNAAVLLDKISRRTVDVPIAYRGFEIPDKFVVGYGMDCGERYRNLSCIAALAAPAE